jgi:hypothetical protein
VRDAYADVFSRLRRRRTPSLAAEMQWELLPLLTFCADRVVITGGWSRPKALGAKASTTRSTATPPSC